MTEPLWQLGIIWKWALPRLACQMTIVKTGSYFFFNIIIGSHSRGHMLSARRGAHTCSWWWNSKSGAWGPGYTINPDGGIASMVSHEGCICDTGPFWQGTGGDLGWEIQLQRASQEPLWVCWQEGRAFPKVLKGMGWWRANPSVMAKFRDSPWERV